MGLLWTKKMSIGNTIVDSGHKHLISLINHIERTIRNAMKRSDNAALQRAFEQLESGLCQHFHNEEKIARAVNFPFERHDQARQLMLEDFRFLKTRLMAKDCIWTEAALQHFCEFLESLVIEHIARVDMPLKSALRGYDYNYWPDWDHAMPGNAVPA